MAKPLNALMYILGRVAIGLLALLFISAFIYAATVSTPVDALAGGAPTEEMRDQIAMPTYFEWLTGAEDTFLSSSLRFRAPVSEIINQRLPATMELLWLTVILTLIVGWLWGVLMAFLRHKLTDIFPRPLLILGTAFPVFWLGLVLIFYLALEARLLPTSGRCSPVSIDDGCGALFGRLQYLVLPVLSLLIVWSSAFGLVIRNGILREIAKDPKQRFSARNVFRALLLLTFASLPVMMAGIFSMAVLIETIVAFPGVGRLALDASTSRDTPVISALALALTVRVVGFYVLFHILYGIIALAFGTNPQGYALTNLIALQATPERQDEIPHALNDGQRRRAISVAWTVVAVVAAVIQLVILAGSFVGGSVTGADPNAVNPADRLLPPGSEGYPLGTDQLGRDNLARLLVGGRTTFSIALGAAVSATLIGFMVGAVGGAVDGIGGRIVNAPINFGITLVSLLPLTVLWMVLIGATDLSTGVLVTFMSLIGWVTVVPPTRALVRALRWQARGRVVNTPPKDATDDDTGSVFADETTVLLSDFQVSPISLLWVLVYGLALNTAAFIVLEMSVSFLGLGVQPPTPSWGNMLSNTQEYLMQSPSLIFVPGVLAVVSVFCLLLVAARLRDTFAFETEAS